MQEDEDVRHLDFIPEETERKLKRAINSPLGIAVRLGLAGLFISQVIIPTLGSIKENLTSAPTTAQSAETTQDTQRAEQAPSGGTQRPSRGTCLNMTIDDLAKEAQERKGLYSNYICSIGVFDYHNADTSTVVVLSTSASSNSRVYCHYQNAPIAPQLLSFEQPLTLSGTVRFDGNNVHLVDCGFRVMGD